VRGLSFTLPHHGIACLLGPSGCGKTTVLRAIAGFVPLQEGRIVLDGREVSGPQAMEAPEKRGIGVVFQDYALFPHLSIADNVAFGLRRWSPAERRKRVSEMLDLVGLQGVAQRFPHQLSGGQQQRVALGRALAPNPALVLMDEPFSNLDVDLRERLSGEVREILKASGTGAVMVTHDQHEAFAMADVIGVIQDGRLDQWDRPYQLYHQPASRFTADFVGAGAFVRGQVSDDADGRRSISMALGNLDGSGYTAGSHGQAVDVLLRPDDVVHDDRAPATAMVVRKLFRGAEFLYTLRLDSGEEVLSLVPSHHNHAIGERIGLRLEVDHVVAFPVGQG
jgi:iron(III) transport system ATP-binding protein